MRYLIMAQHDAVSIQSTTDLVKQHVYSHYFIVNFSMSTFILLAQYYGVLLFRKSFILNKELEIYVKKFILGPQLLGTVW